ncbi:exodeoxyribonuclease V subunit beta [Buchnera aphidicola (Hyadaphis tataricae)]|uniref:RecBCD enzyme subunit RecB n=1 Tax=Buchnera aphidicola (Hyadaphis tataricae) TaxID=1241859 RepID=A0A4D6XZU2_9GAMM|nr:exodeoxyribonuclease V subunit beta [Buchnera aphidicola]QCI21739.1 exodeoxyribonuclease V subunit beta [Buchnera aphidicola (Hyadaphis tataricae)]
MNTYRPKKLDLFKIPLNGINLIEASAGTGKTFTIVLLYLRLLLGLKRDKNVKKKLLINEILIVTFTNAAKEELHRRIKDGIHTLYLICKKNDQPNSLFNIFFKEIVNIEDAICTLDQAQKDIDNISIYTIHGFCQKILNLYAFDFHPIFKENIIEQEETLYLQAIQDFWRRTFYHLPKDIINIIYNEFNHPERLLQQIKPLLNIYSIDFEKKFAKKNSFLYCHKNNINYINYVKKIWKKYYYVILNNIDKIKTNKNIYNSLNIHKWIEKITIWSQTTTTDYTIPSVLKYFRKKNIEKVYFKHILFNSIEKILEKNFSLKNSIILHAVKSIPQIISKEKNKKSLLEYNDLLSILLKKIKQEKHLKYLIREKYPAVFIDEFQDTDPQQYKIFNLIYNTKKTTLFLIGDPKQAIYSFRGADIFSYLKIKNTIKNQYYLDTNWRSSSNMCQSINHLFSQNNHPFIHEKISFIPALSPKKNANMHFTINGMSQSALSFICRKEENSKENNKIWIAQQCANEISYWLTCAQKGTAKITNQKGEKILKSKDIAILVRNKEEANIIQTELHKLNIDSIYSSHKKSIFQTADAKELLSILKSVLEPSNEELFQQAIFTKVFKKIFFKVKEKKNYSCIIIEKLYEYYNIWNETSIFLLIEHIIQEYQKNIHFLGIDINNQKIINFLQIAELLQEKCQHYNQNISLLYWFENKIKEKTQPTFKEHIRSFETSEPIKIVTIHKSKGLEYSITWIPFNISLYPSKLPIYHNSKNLKPFFDIENNNKNVRKAQKETLSEDLRFLYVALTRSIVHCSIGVTYTKKRTMPLKKNYTDLSALKYIIQNGQYMNYHCSLNILQKLIKKNVIEIKNNTKSPKVFTKNNQYLYLLQKPNYSNINIENTWNITSFTKLSQEKKLLIHNNQEIILENFSIENESKKSDLNIHNFPLGITTGRLIHYILKKLNFSNKKTIHWFSEILEMFKISQKWSLIIMSWIETIINIPLSNHKITLSKLKKNSYVKELEFFLPIKKTLYCKEFNNIIQNFDPISHSSPKIFFNPVSGILTGFIDLVLFWNDKYYIIDYKSNWIGKNDNCYSYDHIKKEMIKKRYDIQYQIYTIAVHQYLKTKIKKYNYEKHFGGILYIFLRAIHNKKHNGVFYVLPKFKMIERLIDLIS